MNSLYVNINFSGSIFFIRHTITVVHTNFSWTPRVGFVFDSENFLSSLTSYSMIQLIIEFFYGVYIVLRTLSLLFDTKVCTRCLIFRISIRHIYYVRNLPLSRRTMYLLTYITRRSTHCRL